MIWHNMYESKATSKGEDLHINRGGQIHASLSFTQNDSPNFGIIPNILVLKRRTELYMFGMALGLANVLS